MTPKNEALINLKEEIKPGDSTEDALEKLEAYARSFSTRVFNSLSDELAKYVEGNGYRVTVTFNFDDQVESVAYGRAYNYFH